MLGFFAVHVFGRKIADRQLCREHVLPCTISGLFPDGFRILLRPSNSFLSPFDCTHHQVLQDDDYLVLPEVIHTLHARVTELWRPSAVHLLPPHERLSSDLRGVYAGNNANALHTSFSWLGHGTMMHRSLASEFLSLLQILNLSNEEVKMADNYFTVLRNHPPETWFDQGIELGGGQAFTVGSEGHERTKKHIVSACYSPCGTQIHDVSLAQRVLLS